MYAHWSAAVPLLLCGGSRRSAEVPLQRRARPGGRPLPSQYSSVQTGLLAVRSLSSISSTPSTISTTSSSLGHSFTNQSFSLVWSAPAFGDQQLSGTGILVVGPFSSVSTYSFSSKGSPGSIGEWPTVMSASTSSDYMPGWSLGQYGNMTPSTSCALSPVHSVEAWLSSCSSSVSPAVSSEVSSGIAVPAVPPCSS